MKRNNFGFTLVELIIVIAVIGVLAAILIPVFSNVIAKANEKSARSDARNAVSQYVIDATEDPTLPHEVVIMVFKAGKCYLYGYDMESSSELMCSVQNDAPIGDAATPADAILGYSYNVRVNNTPAPSRDGSYDINTQGAFYLIIHPELRSVRGATICTIPGTGYMNIQTSENLDNVVIFHGYLLGGTFSEDSGSTTSSDSGSVVTPANYTVSYNANGGTGSMPAETVQQGSTSYALPTCTFTAPAGKHFDGWKAGNTGDAIGAGTNYTVTGDTEFYAQWTDAPTCTVSYNANGGTGTMSSDTVAQGATDYTLPANGFTAPAHQHFTGWKANNEGSLINAGTSYTVNNDTVFYAQWTDDVSYSVTYNKNAADATGSLTDNTRYYDGDTATVLANNFERTGYTFKYFTTTSADTGTHYTAGNTITINGAGVTLYAQWQINSYTVTFYANGTQYSTAQVNHGSTATAPTAPTKTGGYTFKHWSLENNGADATTGAEYNFATPITANTSMYAVWNAPAAADSHGIVFRFVDVTGELPQYTHENLYGMTYFREIRFNATQFEEIADTIYYGQYDGIICAIKPVDLGTLFGSYGWPYINTNNPSQAYAQTNGSGTISTKAWRVPDNPTHYLSGTNDPIVCIPVAETTVSGNIITNITIEPAILPSGEQYMDR